MNDERLKILQMIADGKISPEDGAGLLKALDQEEPRIQGGARWLNIRVSESNDKVHNIRLPIAWAGKILNFIKGFARNVEFDMEEVYQAIQGGEPGQIIEVDSDDGTRVEIWLEV